MERSNPNQPEEGEKMIEVDLFGEPFDKSSEVQANLDRIVASSAASGQARYERDKAASQSDEGRPDAFADLGYSHVPDGSLGGAMQALEDSAERQVSEKMKKQPHPWDLSDGQLASNEVGAAASHKVLEELGATAEQRRRAEVALQLVEIADRRERDANLARAAQLANEGRTPLARELHPIEGAINTPEEAQRIADELRRRKDAS